MSCKAKALYVKACVILADTPDSDGDILGREDIKKVFTSYNNRSSFDVYHDGIPLDNVSMLENYICSGEEVISDTVVPAGSWIIVIRVDNPEIQAQLRNGDFGGVSLGSRIAESCIVRQTDGYFGYNDLKSADCINPVLISLVDEPANECGIEIMDYTAYIRKDKGGNNLSLFEELKALLQRFEPEESAEVVADAVEDNADSETVDAVADDVADAVDDDAEPEADAEDEEPAIDKAESEPVTVAKAEEPMDSIVPEEPTVAKAEEPAEPEPSIDKAEGNEEPEPSIDKAEEEEEPEEEPEDEVEQLKARIKELEQALAEATKEEEPIVVKSAKIDTKTEIETNTKSFYEMTGRDALTGKKIRKETKILN